MFFGKQADRSLFVVLATIAVASLLSGCMRPGVWSTDVATVRAALAAGEDPNFTRGGGPTPLIIIAVTGTRNGYGLARDPATSPIPEARRIEISRMLLDAGADPNIAV